MFPKIDYHFYVDEYGGSEVNEDQFNIYSKKALQFINEQSASRLLLNDLDEDDTYLVKMAACALCDYDLNEDKRLEKVRVASESVTSHSRSYNSNAYAKTNEEVRKERIQTIYGFLLSTNLLYRGV